MCGLVEPKPFLSVWAPRIISSNFLVFDSVVLGSFLTWVHWSVLSGRCSGPTENLWRSLLLQFSLLGWSSLCALVTSASQDTQCHLFNSGRVQGSTWVLLPCAGAWNSLSRQQGHHRAHLVGSRSLRDHWTLLPETQCVKTTVWYMFPKIFSCCGKKGKCVPCYFILAESISIKQRF